MIPDYRSAQKWLSSVIAYYTKKARPLDYVVIIGLFFFCVVLVVGLFPSAQGNVQENFFINLLMILPIIIAVYFIFISFKRGLRGDYQRSETGIRTKIALAFMVVAILPSLPVIIASNTVINRALSDVILSDTRQALASAAVISEGRLHSLADTVLGEALSFESGVGKGIVKPQESDSLDFIGMTARRKGISFHAYTVKRKSQWGNLIEELESGGETAGARDVREFIRIHDFPSGCEVSRITASGRGILVATCYVNQVLAVFSREIPSSVMADMDYISKANARYAKRERMLPGIRSGVGIFMLVSSLVIVALSIVVAILLSINITKPVIELAHAAERVAAGDFDVAVHPRGSDEVTYLFGSFNLMVAQLRENRNKMLQMERLKAWRDVSRKLIHEIKNPLTPIRLSAERMKRKCAEGNPDICRVVTGGADTIIEEVNSLQHIMGVFTEYARMPEVKRVPDDLNEVIRSCIRLYEGHEHIGFSFEPDSALGTVLFDRVLLRQALINLIKNSIEAMHDSGNIAMATQLREDEVVIWIRDTGPGIAPDDLSAIFEPTFSRKQGGSGLGLAIVQKIVLEHGGRIECVSAPGEGAEFIIHLPIRGEEPLGEDSDR